MAALKTRRDLPQKILTRETVWIPMRDGCRLAAKLWRPRNAHQSPVPAILEYIPYRRRDLRRQRDQANHGYFAAHGYACLSVDMRGSGDSEGVLEDEYLLQEQEDGEDILDWLEVQPWCTGKVGMIGISWGGFNALQIAARRPRQLKAVVAVAATDDRYNDDVHYMGGCLLNDNLSWAAVMFSLNALPPDPKVVGQRWRRMWHERLDGSGLWLRQWMAHPVRDEYWRHASVCEDYAAIEAPVLIVSGWADGYTNPVFRLLEHLKSPVRGLVGPWSHVYPHLGRSGASIGFLQECLRWWDQWLKGEETGVMEDPALRIWMQTASPPRASSRTERPGYWRTEPAWPSPNVAAQDWRPAPGKALLPPGAEAPAAARPLTVQSPLRVGLFAGKWCSYGAAPDHPYDQRDEDGGSLVFDSEPLESALEILGAPSVELTLASDRPVAMVALRLSDIAPDDKATRVSYGLLNLCQRSSQAEPDPLEAGRRYQVRVPLKVCAHAFQPGNRIRLSVSTSYWPLAWTPPEPVRLTVWPADSRLRLPVRSSRGEEAEGIRAFAGPESARAPAREVVEPEHHNWWIHHDLAGEESTLEVIADEGTYRIPRIDLTVTQRATERYRSRGDDFTSPSGEVCTTRKLRRGDWQITVETRTLLTCDTENFYINASLDAWEGKSRVFSRIFNETIPRRLR
ncbi:CocE/NonD family hydrolase [Spiribacter halobius]|uniref:Peptidase S15 n=1 Tax=Sediminicurvatus halobius TaxID=2182432 RepID=A0A2U2MYM4_9GAMM|nr:CocE/NonD family hydrolase [Spiribacter halobius]PWG61902.1 peptidase S15 [Spiribacter halobius]UEX79223.1 CocE/NonD family hydrolase [Spiribacter halobius]